MRWATPEASATTSSDGRFALRDLISGSYLVRARTGTGIEVAEENVAAGTTGLRITLPAVGGIEGPITGFGDAVRVNARSVDRKNMRFESYRGVVDHGRFRIRELPPGPYAVSARDGDLMDSAEVEVVGGKTATAKLATDGVATVRGRAVDSVSHAPLPDLECNASIGMAGGTSATTDADGRFRLSVPARRDVMVHCRSNDFEDFTFGSAKVNLAPGATGDVVVEVVRRNLDTRTPADLGMALEDAKPAKVKEVTPGGPAALAGVRAGDVILEVDGTEVGDFEPGLVMTLIKGHQVGQKVSLAVQRGGNRFEIQIEFVAAQAP